MIDYLIYLFIRVIDRFIISSIIISIIIIIIIISFIDVMIIIIQMRRNKYVSHIK